MIKLKTIIMFALCNVLNMSMSPEPESQTIAWACILYADNIKCFKYLPITKTGEQTISIDTNEKQSMKFLLNWDGRMVQSFRNVDHNAVCQISMVTQAEIDSGQGRIKHCDLQCAKQELMQAQEQMKRSEEEFRTLDKIYGSQFKQLSSKAQQTITSQYPGMTDLEKQYICGSLYVHLPIAENTQLSEAVKRAFMNRQKCFAFKISNIYQNWMQHVLKILAEVNKIIQEERMQLEAKAQQLQAQNAALYDACAQQKEIAYLKYQVHQLAAQNNALHGTNTRQQRYIEILTDNIRKGIKHNADLRRALAEYQYMMSAQIGAYMANQYSLFGTCDGRVDACMQQMQESIQKSAAAEQEKLALMQQMQELRIALELSQQDLAASAQQAAQHFNIGSDAGSWVNVPHLGT